MSAAVLVFVACAVCCILGHVAILHSVFRSSMPAAPGVPRPKLFVEIVWALVPAVVLAFLLTATWARVRDHTTKKPAVMMKIAR